MNELDLQDKYLVPRPLLYVPTTASADLQLAL